ncbi:DUF3379 domain-containing protein [Aliikangiella coralliicola]|uniref:DUF3379 domain-containing protein n=1 Tax=Aliikangiella coralliicola TaxID=2592383 RepID=A0A545UAR0_9GAMM|nr:DUF3379 domain-containing protein [Aliikangiella coralliicola]TQV86550.1 DUF3379 domain-containing protein [Aliikangiella coralliicola]
MHLSDEQLIELDSNARSHIADCHQCQQKIANLENLRQRLRALPEVPAPENGWLRVSQAYQFQVEQQQARKQVSFWRFSSFALVASLSLVLFFLWPSEKAGQLDQSMSENQLAHSQKLKSLIEQNDLLQQQLNRQLMLNHLDEANFKRLQVELSVVDKALQQAYIQRLGSDEKVQLWQQRQRLIEQLLESAKRPEIVKI